MQIESILESGKGPKQILKVNSKKTRISKMKTKDGTTTSNREEILNICAEFYQQDKLEFKSPDHTDIPNITIDEI